MDAALTFGILWLDVCRLSSINKFHVEGLKLFVPAGCSSLVRERMAHLNRRAAKWQLYEFDQREEDVNEIEIADRGNISTRLVRYVDDNEIRTRFTAPIALVPALMPEAEIAPLSSAEIKFRCHGLEFARARLTAQPGSFRSEPEIVLGSERKKKLSTETTSRSSSVWSAALGRCGIPRGRAIVAFGGCIRSAGWSRWW